MMVLKGKNTFQLLIIMIMASLLVAATSIAIVYRVVLGEKKEYLKELSENQVGIIKSIYEERKNPADVLQFLKHQHKLNATLGNTGEFVVGYLKNDTIFYLLDHLKSNFANPKPIAAGSKLGEPMKFALAKRTGIMKGLDYSNDKVLAYCAYLPELQWGIVTKIDISEVNEPFLKAGLYAAIIAIILVSLATFIFKRVSDPIMEELVRSREEWIETFNLIPDLIAILDDKHRIKRANKAMLDKINAGDLEGHNCFQCVHGSDAPPASCPHTLMLKDHKQHITEIYEPILGGDYLVSVTPILDRKGNFKGGIHVARDVTNLRKKELELLKLNRILQALGKSSMAMLKATNEQSYLEEVCQIVVNDCHFAMVWVGYAQNDSEKSVKPVAYSGFEKGYLETLSISWADTERGHGPTGTAIRTGKPATCKNMLTDPAFAPWREEALKRGYSSSLVLPLIDENKPFGAITIYSVDPDPFTEEETDFLSELASDLSHGILSIRAKIARAKAEEELRQSEQRLKHHFENSPLAVVEWDAEFIVTKWSAEAEHIFGWKAEETIGKPIGTLNIIYEEDIPIVNRTMERLTSGKENTVISANRNYTKSGKIIHCTWYNSILFDGEGKMESVMSLVDDITERKAMEEALQINSKRLEILSQTTSRLLATRNPRTVVNEICAEAMKFLNCQVFFNYILDEKAGKLNLNAYAGIPEKTAKEIEWLEMGASVCGFVALEKQRVVAEKIQETPDPKTDLVKSFGIKAYACHPLLSQEKVIGTLSFGTGTRNSFSDDDIALMKAIADQVAIGLNRVKDEEALLRSEEQYRKLVEISPYAVFINRNNRISFVNPAAVKLFGATNSEEIVGKTPFDIFPPDTHSIVKQRVEKVLTGEPVPIIEIRIRQLDGSERDVEVTGSKFTDQEGVAIQVILRDITERKQAQAIKTRYQLISEYARDPLLLVSVHGEIVEANRAATEFYGYSYQELLNLRIHDLRKNKDGLINNQIVQARQKGILFETIHIRKDGTTVPVEV
ncbi:MAG TPA: PAS domain S-box protein, partial [Bacteroidales bacterium]